MKTNFLTFGNLYPIFGYNRVPNYEQAFSTLIYEIAPREVFFNPECSLSDWKFSDYKLYIKFDEVKNELPKYLGKSFELKKMLRIDAHLKAIKHFEQKIKALKWYQVGKLMNTWYRLRLLDSTPIDIQSVFNYLEYRAKTGLYLSMQKDFIEFARKCKAEPAFSI